MIVASTIVTCDTSSPLAFSRTLDRLEQARRHILLLQQVAKVEDRGFVGKSRRDAEKPTTFLYLAVRQGKPLLKKGRSAASRPNRPADDRARRSADSAV
jgi:hypothetical protein